MKYALIAPKPMLEIIDEACQRYRIPPSLFGRRAVSDPRLVTDLRKGRFLRPETAGRICAFVATLRRA